MKIYFAHSTAFDFRKEFYEPIRDDTNLPQNELILPHEDINHVNNSRDFYHTLDLVIAEVSYPSTGLGIELGWAKDDSTPVFCLYHRGGVFSGSLYAVSNQFFEYANQEEMLSIIERIVNEAKTQKRW